MAGKQEAQPMAATMVPRAAGIEKTGQAHGSDSISRIRQVIVWGLYYGTESSSIYAHNMYYVKLTKWQLI